MGIVYIDEVDKIARKTGGVGTDTPEMSVVKGFSKLYYV